MCLADASALTRCWVGATIFDVLPLADVEIVVRLDFCVSHPCGVAGERGAIHIYDGRRDPDAHLFGRVSNEVDELYCEDSDEEEEEIEGGIPDDIDDDLDL